MPYKRISGISMHYQHDNHEAAELIGHAIEKTVELNKQEWDLPTPSDCHIFLMTSWLSFSFQAPPWPWKIYAALTLPLWAGRARRTWQLAGGWAQAYGMRHAIGIKPPRLLSEVESDLQERIFIKETPEEMLQRITCHELTHAFSQHLRLPAWLNEGLAMLAQDRYFGRQTVCQETQQILRGVAGSAPPPEQIPYTDPDEILNLYALGYWLTRYLAENKPALLQDLLSRPRQRDSFEILLAGHFGFSPDEFWRHIDELLFSSKIGENISQ
jgi:hypothetical protein